MLFLITPLLLSLSVSSEAHDTIEDLVQRIRSLEETVKDQQQQIADLGECERKQMVQRQAAVNDTPVAFSVYISQRLHGMNVNHKIPFDVITTNEGLGYENATSTFTCPRAGLYLFMWNVMTDTGGQAAVSLRINGVISRWSICGDWQARYYENAGNQDIVRLEEGDKVWMAFYDSPGELHPHHTTFSGVWLAN